MKVANLKQVEKRFGLDKTRSKTRRVLFYLAVGDAVSEYTYDFLGSAIHSYLSDPKITQVDKLALLGNLFNITVHDRNSHLYWLGSSGPGQPLYHDWAKSSSPSCESSKDETRTLEEVTCPECLASLGYRSSVCKGI